MKKLGLIVNPVAGMGGTVGLKGTDGPVLLERARELGAVPRAQDRAEVALAQLARLGDTLEILAYGGCMGEDVVVAAGMKSTVVGRPALTVSTPADTKNAARELAVANVGLVLFAGGDGTARDICDAVGTTVTCLGIPAGVKIQSAVYATSPAAAGQVAAAFLAGGVNRTRHAEVMDIDEDEYRNDVLSSRLYGYLEIPHASNRLQNRKATSAPSEHSAQLAIAAEILAQMTDDCFYIVGPGTTCRTLMETLGLDNSLLGVDLIRGRKLVGRDLAEREILDTIGDANCSLILTPIGGQGFLLGRGNQQISPNVIRRVGRENLMVLATMDKIASLSGRALLVDTGDVECDAYLSGYYRVVTGFREATMYRVSDNT
jgi:predicted polyphosphate/ATP-dependent NAD kinase